MLQDGGMSLQDAKDMAPKGEFLAYINNKEADMLKKAGGSGIMTKAGIPSFVEYGGQSGFEGAKSTGTVGGDVDRGAQHAQEVAREKARQEAARQAELRKTVQKFEEEKRQQKLERFRRLNTPKRKFEKLVSKIPGVLNVFSRITNKPSNLRDFYAEEVAPPGFEDLSLSRQDELFDDYEDKRSTGEIDAYGNPTNADKGEAGLDQARMGIPALAFQAPQVPTTSGDYYGGTNPFDINRIAYRLMADGGAVMDDEPRQAYGLGSIVKKATRAVKKVVKSDVGKAAIAAAGIYYLGGGTFGGLRSGAPGFSFGNLPGGSFFGKGSFNPLKALSIGGDIMQSPFGKIVSGIPGGGVTAAIAGTSLLAGLLTPKQEEEAQELARGQGIDIEEARRSILNAGTSQDFRARRFVAEGGPAEGKEPVAKKVMPLIDMDGKEKDYRETGGFVDMGRMEKADDVPARLSKNEFVFTADAVRNAGDGSVDKGAEVMYNMMKNLEAGGEVSEESQGLEGARKMFQTSQRIEEVL
jgi:hypothetical protein